MQKTCHKIVLTQKQMILTSKRRAEHPLAGQERERERDTHTHNKNKGH